jgi:hypothetical protein
MDPEGIRYQVLQAIDQIHLVNHSRRLMMRSQKKHDR